MIKTIFATTIGLAFISLVATVIYYGFKLGVYLTEGYEFNLEYFANVVLVINVLGASYLIGNYLVDTLKEVSNEKL